MNPRATILLAALACATPLAAQSVASGPRLLRLYTSASGARISLDSAAIARTADSAWAVSAVYQAGEGEDQYVENQEVDCAGTRFRGRRRWSFGTTTVPASPEDEAAGPGWRAAAEDELPIFQLICGYLLGSFATSLPVTLEVFSVDRQPELENRTEIAQLLARAYPSSLLDVGTPGAVTIRMQINPEGRVDLTTFGPLWATRPQFAEAARGVAARMRFRPALLHGRPTAVWVTLPVSFDHSDNPSRPPTPAAPEGSEAPAAVRPRP